MKTIGTKVEVTQGPLKDQAATITARGAGPRTGWYQVSLGGTAHYWVPANCTKDLPEPATPEEIAQHWEDLEQSWTRPPGGMHECD